MLVEPSHPGNVGAAARAMRVMGLRELWLVTPRVADAPSHPDAIAFASGAHDVLARARIVASLDEALADIGFSIAVSAAPREFGAVPRDPDACAREAIDELADDHTLRAALVFGPERTGLTIAQVQRCQRVCTIPGEPDYHSLNLAQAVQLIAWSVRRAALLGARATNASAIVDDASAMSTPAADAHARGRSRAPASGVEALLQHLERALVAVQFLDPRHPKKLMPRIRRLLARAGLEPEEVHLLRGICKQMELAAAGRLPRGVSRAARARDVPKTASDASVSPSAGDPESP